MVMIHQIKPKTQRKRQKTVGRGGKRGKTSGRGHKGQKAHAGGRIRPEMRDIIKRFPKKRGYRFKSFRSKPATVSIADIARVFKSREEISPKSLVEKKLIDKEGGRIPKVKILSDGEIKKKITVSDCLLSKTAAEKIKKAGGQIK